MGFFNRSREEPAKQYIPAPPLSKKCEHKWQDFPWYLEWGDNTVDVIEPYVCIYCKERENKNLCHYTEVNNIRAFTEELREKFAGHIKYKEEVEDMVNDFKLIDINHLRWYHYLTDTKDPSTSRPTDKIQKKIKLKF